MMLASARQAGLVAVVLGVGLLATAGGWHSARKVSDEVARREFEKRAADVTFRLRHGFSGYESVLRAGAALFSTGRQVDRDAWRAFVASTDMERRYPGMVALGYARYLRPGQVAPLERELRRSGLAGYRVWPESGRDVRVPVLASEPEYRNALALGFDMFTEPSRRRALEMARDTGVPALTGKLTLVFDQTQPANSGFIAYVPFYRSHSLRASVDRRRRAIEGYVFGAFRMREVLEPLAGQLPDGVDVAIYDGAQPAPEQLMFDSAAARSVRDAAWQPALRSEQTMELTDQVWTLRFSSGPGFQQATDSSLPTLVAVSGGTLSLLLAGLVLSIGRTRDRALELASGMTTELRAATAELQAIYDSSPLGVWRADRDGAIVDANARSEQICGVPASQLVGERWLDFVHADDRASLVAQWSQAVAAGRAYAHQFRFRRGDGAWIWLSAKSAPLVRLGRIEGHVGTIEDVTARHDAVDAVERSRAFLDAVIDAMPQGVFVEDEQSRFLLANQAFCDLVGARREQVLGHTTEEVFPREWAATMHAQDDAVFRTGERLLVEEPRLSLSGEQGWLLKSKSAVRLPDGSRYLVNVSTDITQWKTAALEVEQAKAFLDALINAIPHPVYVKDRDHRWVLVNDAMCEMLGRTREWMIGRTDADHFDAAHTRAVWDEDDAVFASGRAIMAENCIATARRGMVWLLKSKSLIRLPDGRQYIVAISTDITKRREAELDAERHRQFLKLVLDAMPQGVFVKDAEGRWLMVNQATARMIGAPRERIEGRLPHEVLPPALADAVGAQDRQTLEHGGPLTFEQALPAVDGRTVWVMKTESAVRMPDGTRYLVGVNTDVSELKQATVQLEHAREFLDVLLDSVPVPVIVKDRQGRRVFVNEAACSFVGRAREAMLGRTDAELFPAEQATVYAAQDDAAFSSPRVVQYEESFTPVEGDPRWVVKTKRAVELADGSRYLILVSLDITERKAAEAALERSRGRLELVNAILADFTSGQPVDAVLRNAVRDLSAQLPGLRAGYSTIDREDRLRVLHARQPAGMSDLEGLEVDLRAAPRYLDRLRRGEMSALAEAQAGSGACPPWLDLRAAAWLDISVRHDEELLGLLSLDAPRPHEWTAHEIDTLRKVAEALQAVLHAARTEARRRRAERETRSARELLDAVVQAVPVVVSVKDEQHRIVFINHAAERLLGRPSSYFIGKTDFELYPPEQAQRLRDQDQAARGSDEVVTIEEEFLDTQCELRWLVKRKRGVTLPDGQRGVLITLYDITELKRTERALRESEGKLRVALLASRIGLWTLDARDWQVDLSASWYEQMGLDPAQEPVRTVEQWAARVHPDERDAKLAGAREYLRNGRSDFEMEWRLLCGDGQFRHFLARGVIERSADGRVTRVAGAQIDISELKQIEAELTRHRDHLQELVAERTREVVLAKEAAEAASRAKSEFLANMSHELRTPMHAILSFTRLALEKLGGDDPPLSRIGQHLSRVEQSGERLLTLLNDLLDLSKLEVGKMRYEMVRADLRAVVAAVVDECAALSRDRELLVSVERRTDDTHAWCDPHRIAQVVRNLLSNAIKFSPRGGRVEIVLEHASETSARLLALTVRDEGVGIPEGELHAIFDKFVQSSTTKSNAGGTGLGLSICRQIVEDHGGTIRAGNNPQGGAFFRLMLPRSPAQAGSPAGERQQRKAA